MISIIYNLYAIFIFKYLHCIPNTPRKVFHVKIKQNLLLRCKSMTSSFGGVGSGGELLLWYERHCCNPSKPHRGANNWGLSKTLTIFTSLRMVKCYCYFYLFGLHPNGKIYHAGGCIWMFKNTNCFYRPSAKDIILWVVRLHEYVWNKTSHFLATRTLHNLSVNHFCAPFRHILPWYERWKVCHFKASYVSMTNLGAFVSWWHMPEWRSKFASTHTFQCLSLVQSTALRK